MSEPKLPHAANGPSYAQIPDYERLCALSEAFPALDPIVVLATKTVRAVGAELAQALEKSLTRHGLTEGRIRLASNLLLAGGALSPSQLAERAGVTRGTITGLIDALEREGYVARKPDENDRRATQVELLPAGRAMLDRVLPAHLVRLSKMMSGLTAAEQKQLTELLLKVRGGLSVLQSDEGEVS